MILGGFMWGLQRYFPISNSKIYNARVCKIRCSPRTDSPRMCPGYRGRCRFATAASPERITNDTGELMVNCPNAMQEPEL